MKNLFDIKALEQNRKRAETHFSSLLFSEIAERVVDRLRDIRRPFSKILDLTPFHTGKLTPFLQALYPEASFYDAEEKELSAFAPHSFDCIISVLNMHWIQALPEHLLILKYLLKPDGLLLAAFWGGDTLHELRRALIQAETALKGGISPRIIPMVSVLDAASLLQKAGFALPVVDHDTMTVLYPDLFALGKHLRHMGESNALEGRLRTFTNQSFFQLSETFYRKEFETQTKEIPATFQLITLTGWAPDSSQPKALRPGSGKTDLATLLSIRQKH